MSNQKHKDVGRVIPNAKKYFYSNKKNIELEHFSDKDNQFQDNEAISKEQVIGKKIDFTPFVKMYVCEEIDSFELICRSSLYKCFYDTFSDNPINDKDSQIFKFLQTTQPEEKPFYLQLFNFIYTYGLKELNESFINVYSKVENKPFYATESYKKMLDGSFNLLLNQMIQEKKLPQWEIEYQYEKLYFTEDMEFKKVEIIAKEPQDDIYIQPNPHADNQTYWAGYLAFNQKEQDYPSLLKSAFIQYNPHFKEQAEKIEDKIFDGFYFNMFYSTFIYMTNANFRFQMTQRYLDHTRSGRLKRSLQTLVDKLKQEQIDNAPVIVNQKQKIVDEIMDNLSSISRLRIGSSATDRLQTEIKSFINPPHLDMMRVGVDYLHNKTISGELLMNDLGFQGVEYGNWVKQKKVTTHDNDLDERGLFLTHTYQSMTDLAQILDIPQQEMGLKRPDGKALVVAFGSRGKSDASLAQYTANEHFFHLKRFKGANGTIGHEWFHALDSTLFFKFTHELGEKTKQATYRARDILDTLENLKKNHVEPFFSSVCYFAIQNKDTYLQSLLKNFNSGFFEMQQKIFEKSFNPKPFSITDEKELNKWLLSQTKDSQVDFQNSTQECFKKSINHVKKMAKNLNLLLSEPKLFEHNPNSVIASTFEFFLPEEYLNQLYDKHQISRTKGLLNWKDLLKPLRLKDFQDEEDYLKAEQKQKDFFAELLPVVKSQVGEFKENIFTTQNITQYANKIQDVLHEFTQKPEYINYVNEMKQIFGNKNNLENKIFKKYLTVERKAINPLFNAFYSKVMDTPHLKKKREAFCQHYISFIQERFQDDNNMFIKSMVQDICRNIPFLSLHQVAPEIVNHAVLNIAKESNPEHKLTEIGSMFFHSAKKIDALNMGKYFSLPEEMFARFGEAFIHQNALGVNHFLFNLSHKGDDTDYKMNMTKLFLGFDIYPKGEELMSLSESFRKGIKQMIPQGFNLNIQDFPQVKHDEGVDLFVPQKTLLNAVVAQAQPETTRTEMFSQSNQLGLNQETVIDDLFGGTPVLASSAECNRKRR